MAGAPAVLLWPGLNVSAHVHFVEAGPRWADEYGLRVLAVEPPGWGAPPLPADDYRPTVLVARIVELLDRLELERVSYVGWSWGASIGVHLAKRVAERLSALVLLDAGYTDLQDQPGYEEKEAALTSEWLAHAAAAKWPSWEDVLAFARQRTRAWRPALEERARASMREDDGLITPLAAPEAFAAAAHGVAQERPSSTLSALGQLDLPILLVVASETVANEWAARGLQRFRAAVPHADVRQIDSGHDLLADAPNATIQAVGDWLRGAGVLAASAEARSRTSPA